MEKILGSEIPRLFTPPLRELTAQTSLGFDVIAWAESKLDWHPFPWQRWALIHALELNEDGSFRHARCLLVLARQNGKTEVLAILSLYFMSHGVRLILSASASNETARETWHRMVDIANDHKDVFGAVKARARAGAEEIELPLYGSRYKVISKNRRGGRGIPANKVVFDELREHVDFESVSAAEPAISAQEDGQLFYLSNAGDQTSIVLERYREQAIQGLPGWFLAEWSAPEETSDLSDPQAWVAANPSLGHPGGKTWTAMESALALPVAKYKTEHLSMSVGSMVPGAISPAHWNDCRDPAPFSEAQRARTVCGIDISPDGQHISLVGAVKLADGRIRVEGIATWTSSEDMRAELPELLKRVRPRKVGWFPESAGIIATDIKALRMNVELSGREITGSCQELADLVRAGRIVHNGDPLLTEQLLASKKLQSGEGWKFSRRGGYCDSAYALAACVHLARSMPAPTRLRFVSAKEADN